MPTPVTTPDRLPARGAGIFDDQAPGLPDWDCAEAADRDSAEPADWDLADLADWEPEDPEGEPLELAMPDPEAPDPKVLDPKVWTRRRNAVAPGMPRAGAGRRGRLAHGARLAATVAGSPLEG